MYNVQRECDRNNEMGSTFLTSVTEWGDRRTKILPTKRKWKRSSSNYILSFSQRQWWTNFTKT